MISALERLRTLRAGEPLPDEPPPPEPSVEDLPPDFREEFEERASIREYDGNQTREEAERGAFREILAKIQAAKNTDRAA